MKKILGLIVTLVLVLGGCSNGNEKQDNQFVVGMECDYAPYNWTTTEAEKSDYAILASGSKTAYCDGYDVKVASEVAASLNKELVIKKISWDGLIPALQQGEIDAIIAGMSPTDERKQTINFSNSYFEDIPIQGMMVKADSNLANSTTLKDFTGKKIGAQLGTLQEGLIEQVPNVVKATSLDSYGALMQALQSGTIDGYIVENVVGIQQASETPGIKYVDFSQGEGFVLSLEQTTTAIGIDKNNDALLNDVNAALEKISPSTRLSWMEEATSKSKDK